MSSAVGNGSMAPVTSRLEYHTARSLLIKVTQVLIGCVSALKVEMYRAYCRVDSNFVSGAFAPLVFGDSSEISHPLQPTAPYYGINIHSSM